MLILLIPICNLRPSRRPASRARNTSTRTCSVCGGPAHVTEGGLDYCYSHIPGGF